MFISDCLDICEPVFTFDELIGGLDLDKYLKNVPEHKLGRIGYNPFRAVNFEIGGDGKMRCPNGKTFNFLYRKPVKGNQYGRKEEVYQSVMISIAFINPITF